MPKREKREAPAELVRGVVLPFTEQLLQSTIMRRERFGRPFEWCRENQATSRELSPQAVWIKAPRKQEPNRDDVKYEVHLATDRSYACLELWKGLCKMKREVWRCVGRFTAQPFPGDQEYEKLCELYKLGCASLRPGAKLFSEEEDQMYYHIFSL